MAKPVAKMKPAQMGFILLFLFAFATPVSCFWRLLCHGQLGVARVDPVAAFGLISDHAHTIHGARNVGFSSTADDLMQSDCTSCQVLEDKSAYWTPALYFKHENGTYELVPQSGGMTAYYFNDNAYPGENLTAFRPGFKMIAGDTPRRNFTWPIPDTEMSFWVESDMTQESLGAKATGFNCLHYQNNLDEGSMVYHYLRNKTYTDAHCPDGVRFELMFPSCWNGKDLDSEDHKSHMKYPHLIKTGDCPKGFETRMPVLFYETIWQTFLFINNPGQFVIANGDVDGFGYHGDFIAGWNESFLQEALNTCTNSSGQTEDCHLFTIQDDFNATSCKMNIPDELVDEDVVGPLDALPGNVEIFLGPEPAPVCSGTPIGGSVMTMTAMSSGINMAAMSSSTDMAAAMSSSESSSDLSMANMSMSSAATSISVDMSSMVPFTTPCPTPSTSASSPLFYTTTTSFVSNGEEVHLVIVEEAVTVTITATYAAPNCCASIGAGAKRHVHTHQHPHGGHAGVHAGHHH